MEKNVSLPAGILVFINGTGYLTLLMTALFLVFYFIDVACFSVSVVRGADSPICCAVYLTDSPISRHATTVSSTLVAVSLITPRSFNSLAVSLISFVVSLAAITASWTAVTSSSIAPL